MTTAADDSAAEEAFEAYLRGKAVPEPGAAVAAFAGAVRATATQPGRPSAALAELLATGLLVDQPPLSVRTAKRRRRRMWFFSVVFAKIASAGAIAQAATGAGIVLVGFTGVGAAGALPTPVQHGFATVVAAVTPLTAPDSAGGTSNSDPGRSTEVPAGTTGPAAATTGAAQPTSADGTRTADPATTTPADPTTAAPSNSGSNVEHDGQHGNTGVDETDGQQNDGSKASATKVPESHRTTGSDGESTRSSGRSSGGQGSKQGDGGNSGDSGGNGSGNG